MKDFIEELLYMCKSSKIKGFYILITVLLCALLLLDVAALVVLVLNLVLYKAFSWLWIALFGVATAIIVGIVIWLKKS